MNNIGKKNETSCPSLRESRALLLVTQTVLHKETKYNITYFIKPTAYTMKFVKVIAGADLINSTTLIGNIFRYGEYLTKYKDT